MFPGLDKNYDYEAKILKESDFFISLPFVEALNYFAGVDGKMRNWDYHCDREPGDLCKTPVSPLVSEKIKAIADELQIPAKYHKANLLINGVSSKTQYYLVKPLNVLDFVDRKSGETRITPKSDKYKPEWIEIDETSTTVSYKNLGDLNWVTQSKSLLAPWLVSEKFKQMLEEADLNGKIKFYPVKDSKK